MPDHIKLRITEMPQASVMSDGSTVEVAFKAENGGLALLTLDPDDLLMLSLRFNQLVHQAQTNKRATAGHFELQALPVARAAAQAPVGGKAVVASMSVRNGQVFHFAMHPDEANVLKNQLREAIASARKQARQTRQ